ncbi:tRNA guanosine(34) transglycosylase Tgt [Oligoflexaceae bacterium]|nr:tRNA guanosine(34) transglycosylase Tgt [Oligoflexaceae bacterium]
MTRIGSFKIDATSGQARSGELTLKHGVVQTPIFMPVGTAGCVKSLVPKDLEELGAQIILGNTYHLFLRPGMEVIGKFGGLHKFANWTKPILTDSGGFQIFSLGKLNKLSEEGAAFHSHLDGKKFHLTPELSTEIQETIGSDIHMVLDECTPFPVEKKVAEESMERSMRWAARCRKAKKIDDLCQFGIVQGSVFEDLRRRSAEALTELDFEGFAIGGLSVGESKEHMREVTAYTCPMLPDDKPRYLMGVGTPLDLIESVACGVDMFDCVMPTRNGRNGMAFTSLGRINIKNEKFKFDEDPLDPACTCYTCQTFSKSYLRHLYVAAEPTSMRLMSLHNLTYYLNLMKDIKASIQNDSFDSLLKHHRDVWDR